MTERYTKAESFYARARYCPMQESRRCVGPACMAWICEVDEDERPTGLGRCGMVSSWIIGPCVTTPLEEVEELVLYSARDLPNKYDIVMFRDEDDEPWLVRPFLAYRPQYPVYRWADQSGTTWKQCAHFNERAFKESQKFYKEPKDV